MNAFADLIQAAKDMDFHGADYWSAPSIEARERAKKASRKLFPPMAKPLVWIELDGVCKAGQYVITPSHGGTFFCSQIYHCALKIDIDAAKASCEAHHQARFLELLA